MRTRLHPSTADFRLRTGVIARCVMGALLICTISRTGFAAEIRVLEKSNSEADITISGEIEPHDDEKFSSFASRFEMATVWLQSPGGSVGAAVNIGTALRLKLWRTAVPQGETCASACALIWLAGTHRSVGIGGQVGFHAVYAIKEGVRQEIGSGNGLVGAYLNKLGMRDTAIIYLTSASPESILWLTPDDAQAIGITADFNSPEATPLPVEKHPPSSGITTTLALPPPASGPALRPGEQPNAPTPLSVDQMMRELDRGFPTSVTLQGEPICLRAKCSISAITHETWTGTDGKPRRMVVAVVETGGCHGCQAVLGVGVYRWDYVTWASEIETPSVTGVGSWGKYSGGDIEVIDAADLGRALLVHDGFFGHGESEEINRLVMSVLGTFKEVLRISTSYNIGASCDLKEQKCQQRAELENYTSEISVKVSSDEGLDVRQNFTSGRNAGQIKTWHVTQNGTVEADATHGNLPTPQDPAQAASPSYSQGHADRIVYEDWFKSLSADGKAGAEFWASQRSLKNPPSCLTAKPSLPEWTAGCVEAKQRLSPSDARRKADPLYRQGWNSF